MVSISGEPVCQIPICKKKATTDTSVKTALETIAGTSACWKYITKRLAPWLTIVLVILTEYLPIHLYHKNATVLLETTVIGIATA